VCQKKEKIGQQQNRKVFNSSTSSCGPNKAAKQTNCVC